ncbi:MAG: imelysin [Saprospiraceae bacterium]|nr:imelysin [Saprospiraceae bacterium]
MQFKFLPTFLLILIASILGCSDDDGGTTITTNEFTAIIDNISDNVIIATYADLDAKADVLLSALSALKADQTAQTLEAARQAWRDARRPWELSEGFLYGPVDTKGLDPAMDSWPVNVTDLENVLNSNNNLTVDYVDGLDGTLRGFHTIEYLLFGEDGTKLVTDFTVRQFEYLGACGESLKLTTAKLYEGWIPSGGNFVKNFKEAGTGTAASVYPSQKAVIEEIVNGIVGIADEVANGKINEPFAQQNLALEESRFSANSKADFADNIRSIRNIWFGVYENAAGKGIADLIFDKDAVLDAKVRSQIDAAIAAIEGIEGTFTSAVFNSPSTVQAAQQAVRDLLATLQGEVLPVVSNL